MKNRIPITTLCLCAFVAILNSCGNNKEATQATSEDRNVPTVLVGNPEKHQFSASIQISGTAKPNEQVKLFAMTNGFIKQLKADIGDFVKEGQTLVVLENPELFGDKSRLDAELKGKKSIYERLKGVYAKTPQLTTLAEVEKAEAAYESARAELNNMVTQIGFLNVKAPFSGVVVNRMVDKGAVIQCGLNTPNSMPLFEIQAVQPIRLTIDVPETDAALITQGTKVEITFPEMPDLKISASVSRIAFGLDETTKTMKVEIDIPNKDLKIRPGMYAKVEIQRSGHKDALSVPNEAVGNIKGQSFVFVIENGIARKVEVKTGVRDEKYTELLSGNLQPTDKIVVQGKEFCSDGAKVQVKSLSIN